MLAQIDRHPSDPDETSRHRIDESAVHAVASDPDPPTRPRTLQSVADKPLDTTVMLDDPVGWWLVAWTLLGVKIKLLSSVIALVRDPTSSITVVVKPREDRITLEPCRTERLLSDVHDVPSLPLIPTRPVIVIRGTPIAII